MKLAVAVAAVIAVVAPTPANAQRAATIDNLVLESQTAWVGAGGTFQLRVSAPPEQAVGPEDLEFAVAVHPSSPTRNAFARTLTSRATSAPLGVVTTAYTETVTDDSGAVTLDVGIQDPALPRDRTRIALRGAGVYPVTADLRTIGGEVHARLLTHLIFVPQPPTGPRLAVGMVVPIRAPVSLQPTGEDALTSRDITAITSVAQTLASLPPQGILLAPAPETLAAVLRNEDAAGDLAREALRTLAPTHAIVPSPFVPTHSALTPEDARVASAARGRALITATFGSATLTDLVVIDDIADDRLTGGLPARVVVREAMLLPQTQRLTTAEPIALRRSGSARTTTPGLLADPGLSAHLRNTASPVLAAHHLLADLATVYFDSPGRFRSIIVVPTETWRANSRVLAPLLAGLASSPILEAASTERLFTLATPRTVPRTRTLLPTPTRAASDSLRAVRRTAAALRTVMADAPAALQSLDDRMLIAQSTVLTSTQRRRYVSGLGDALVDERRKFQLPTGASLTLTARRGAIPITVRSSADYPARVLLQVASDRLKFPGGDTRTLRLSRHDTTERFVVQSLGSGAFPLRILLKSPDGEVILSQTRLTVRSTNASGVGVALSVGAGVFLLLWWYRHSRRRRAIAE